MISKYYKGGENQATIEHLLLGETVIVGGKGNSMTPKLKSGEFVIVEPITENTKIKKRDIALCKVKATKKKSFEVCEDIVRQYVELSAHEFLNSFDYSVTLESDG